MATIQQAKTILTVSKKLVTFSNALSSSKSVSNATLGLAVASSVSAAFLLGSYVKPWLQADNATIKFALEGGGINPDDVEESLEVAFPTDDVAITVFNGKQGVAPPPKRRIRTGGRGKFIREIVAAVKLRLGTPKPTLANKKAVQRVAREEMLNYNLRKEVASSIMPMIVEAVFVPSKWELEAARVSTCMLAQSRKTQFNLFSSMAGFGQA